MPILFFPRAGQILMCDFSAFKEPEMTKIRPVIVVSPRLPHRAEIVSVVPISLTAPNHNLPFVVRLSKNYHPSEPDDLPCWAKCDMVTNLARWRLEGFKVGRRKWNFPQAVAGDLDAVKRGIVYGLGLQNLILGPQ